MARRTGKKKDTQSKLQDLVAVTITNDLEEAKDHEALLKNSDIPAVIKEQADSRDFAVMVPEENIDEAHVVIESQEAYDDFYDFALENEEEDDFGDDIFEEEF